MSKAAPTDDWLAKVVDRLVDRVADCPQDVDPVLGTAATLCVRAPIGTLLFMPAHLLTIPTAVPWASLFYLGHGASFAALRARRPMLALHLCLASLTAHFATLTWFSGGMTSPLLWFLALVPTLPLFLGARREAVGWSAVSAGVFLGFAWGDMHGVPVVALPGETTLLHVTSLVGLLIANVMIVGQLKLNQSQLRHRLEEVRTELVTLTDAKRNFVASVNHELRTPMNGIIGMTGLLLQTGLDAQQRQYAGFIRTSARTLHQMVSDILDVSDHDAGKLSIHPRPFSIRGLAREVLDVFEIAARHKGLTLNADFGAETPDLLVGDAARIRQVLYNLMSNSIKFTDAGSVRIHVYSLGETPGRVRLGIEVCDTGVGVPLDQQRRIFERFHQADQADSRSIGGAGIGLTLCYAIVEAMGGSIGLRSVVGKGTTISVQLELGLQDSAADTRDEPSYEITVDPDDTLMKETLTTSNSDRAFLEPQYTDRIHILLVEDNPVNQRVTAAMLSRLGCTVDIAEDGPDGVRMAATTTYDLILMDCELPSMDGFQASRLIRNAPNGDQTPIVALTTDSLDNARVRAQRAGMADFLTKPVTLDSLRNVVTAWSGARHSRQA